MVVEMKEKFSKINTQMKNYQDWFDILKIPALSEDELYNTMVEAVRFSIVTPGYHWSSKATGGGWGPVLDKYTDMIKEAKAKRDAEKETSGDTATKPAAMEVDAEATGKEKGKGNSGRGRGSSRGRGKAAGGRGKKRKADSDDDCSDDDYSGRRGGGRGRGRGGAKKWR